MKITNTDIWKAIWLDENRASGTAADFLRSLLQAPKAPTSSKGRHKVAIVIGHNSKAPGAYAPKPLNKSEYVFNGEVSDELVRLAESDPNLQVKVFRRKSFKSYRAQISDVYKRVNAWKPNFTLELHFNYLSGAGRIEMLHYPRSSKGIEIAKVLLDETAKKFSGAKKLISRRSTERGGLSLSLCSSPCVMTEPFDCSHFPHVQTAEEIGASGLARIYYNSISQISE